jgi:hypothetical protein
MYYVYNLQDTKHVCFHVPVFNLYVGMNSHRHEQLLCNQFLIHQKQSFSFHNTSNTLINGDTRINFLTI